jgi:uncharacterized protein YoxC
MMASLNSTTGYEVPAPPEQRLPSTTETLTNRLNGIAAELESVLIRLNNSADRLFGEQATASGTATHLEQVRAGSIGDLHAAVEQVERRISQAADVAARFAGL